ncbi:MAG: hypothetical protein WAZ77_01180 [Candidatus Nitrosopolaris sp.]
MDLTSTEIIIETYSNRVSIIFQMLLLPESKRVWTAVEWKSKSATQFPNSYSPSSSSPDIKSLLVAVYSMKEINHGSTILFNR